MEIELHHVHIFASDLSASIAWYRDMLGGEVRWDGDFAGARNVFMKIGRGRLHLYDQPPRDRARGAIHHIGIRTDDLDALHERLLSRGVGFRSGIRDFDYARYIMCAAPDDVLLELFEPNSERLPKAAAAFLLGED